ncbi:alpha/beta hydrolase [Streptomyces sp. E11-3]|uniref:alpha/beta fold hydrolase n=1 Tax=Streptomyces sp. E11-3 TaxID=3110112 RepID=UPI003980F696
MGRAISRDGTPIVYGSTGAGPAVILVSGALCTGAAEEDPLAAQLAAQGLTAISYDRRGRGGSGDTLPYAVAREVEDIAALIERVGGNVALHGTSSGGALAMEAAASGLPITKVSAYEPPLTPDEEGVPARRQQAARLRELLAADRRGDAVEYFVSGTGAPPGVIAELRKSPMWAGWEALAPTIAYDFEVLGDSLVPVDRLAAVSVPLLVINGTESFDWMAEAAREIARAAPDGQHLMLEGQTHMADPEVLAPVLAEFHVKG